MKSYCSSRLDGPGSLDRLDMYSNRMGSELVDGEFEQIWLVFSVGYILEDSETMELFEKIYQKIIKLIRIYFLNYFWKFLSLLWRRS